MMKHALSFLAGAVVAAAVMVVWPDSEPATKPMLSCVWDGEALDCEKRGF